MRDLKKIPAKTEVILKGDPRVESYRNDAVISGDPDAIVRPRDWQEVAEILSWCNGNGVPVTVCGARTSMTGSSVAKEGVLITTDHFNKIKDIGVISGRAYAVVEPAVIAKDFQRRVEEKGYHYPVVPTSCDNAFLGGNVSTNATGEDFYKYGPTRSFVREISYIKMDGTTGTLKRTKDAPPPLKGRGGYFMDGEEIDRVIGSEGTLVVITSLVVDLLPKIPKTFVILAPFPSREDALQFISTANESGWNPRSLEYIDTFAIKLMRTHKDCPDFNDNIKAFVYIKDETFDGSIDPLIEKWAERISDALAKTPRLMNETMVAVTEKEKEQMHALRHQIPEATVEMSEPLKKSGGGKVSGDWWVPKDKMFNTMKKVYEKVLPLNLDFTLYGHLGDGHAHTTFICKTQQELALAKEIVMQQAKAAALMGGGVAGEHGIGKIKHELLSIQYSPEIIAKMRRIKTDYDPKWLLGKGNIFKTDCHSGML